MKLTAFLLSMLPCLLQACPFSHLSEDNPHEGRLLRENDGAAQEVEEKDSWRAERWLLGCDGLFRPRKADKAIRAAKSDIQDILQRDGRLGPKFVRLGFHDCVGGCDGCVNMANPDNAGLDLPIDALRPVVQNYDNLLTRADIWALAAMTAAEAMQGNVDGRQSYDFNYYGRKTCSDETGGPDVTLPSSHLTTSGVLSFFNSAFGFDATETVAIMGGHALGRLSNRNSGFDGSWIPQGDQLNNRYFQFLVNNGNPTADYTSTNARNGNGDFLWRRNGADGLVMLNADMSLITDFSGNINSDTGAVTCTPQTCPAASTFSQAAAYSQNNAQFLQDFHNAFVKMMLNGYSPASCEKPPCEL